MGTMMLRKQEGGTKRSYNQSAECINDRNEKETRRTKKNGSQLFWRGFSLAAVDPIGLDVRTLLLQIGVYRNPYVGLYTETKWSP